MLRTTMAVCASLGLLLAGPAGAAEAAAKKAARTEMTFEGQITSVDVPARQFTVRSSDTSSVSEMTFHVGHRSSIIVDHELTPIGALAKGEHVTVTYEEGGPTPLARHLHRHKKHAKT
jgi:hypothetical protein